MQPEIADKFMDVIRSLATDAIRVKALVNQTYSTDSSIDRDKLTNELMNSFKKIYDSAKQGKNSDDTLDEIHTGLFQKACQRVGLNLSQLGEYQKKKEDETLWIDAAALQAIAQKYIPERSRRF